MNKTLSLACVLSTMAMFNAGASEFKPYVGIEGSVINLKDYDGNEKTPIGINVGSKIKLNDQVFMFGEAYINIANKIANEDYEINRYDSYLDEFQEGKGKIEFKNTYGIRLGLGINITEQFSAKLMATADHFKYSIKENFDIYDISHIYIGYGLADSNSKGFAIGYGVGLGYNVTENFEIKANYLFQQYDRDDLDIKMHNINLGLAYNF